MGQGVSKSSEIDKYLQNASRHELLRHYGSVNVESREYSDSKSNDSKNEIKPENYDNEEIVIDLCETIDNEEQDNFERKASKDLSENSFPSTSTDRILEDYAEYANELINAPYALHNRFTSNETIDSNSKTQDFEFFNIEGLSNSKRPSCVDEIYLESTSSGIIAQHGEDRDNDKDVQTYGYVLPERIDLPHRETADTVYANIPDIVITAPELEHTNGTDLAETVQATVASDSHSVAEQQRLTHDQQVNNACAQTTNSVTCDLEYLEPLQISRKGIQNCNQNSCASPCLKRYLTQEAELHKLGLYSGDLNAEVNAEPSDTVDQSHKPPKRRGAVLVEVVQNGDSASEASTITSSGGRRGHYSSPNRASSRHFGKDNVYLTKLNKLIQNKSNVRPVNANEIPDAKSSKHYCGQLHQRPNYFVKQLDNVSKIAIGHRHPHVDPIPQEELYDDVISRPLDSQTTDGSCIEGSVKSLAEKFENIAKSSRESSPVRVAPYSQNGLATNFEGSAKSGRQNSPITYKQSAHSGIVSKCRNSTRSSRQYSPARYTQTLKSRAENRSPRQEFEEESIYEEFSVDIPVRRSSRRLVKPKTFKNQGAQTEGSGALSRNKWNYQRLEPLSIETSNMVFNRKSKKSDKRSRHKSDSSTSAVSDASFTAHKSSGKWKKKDKRRSTEKGNDSVQQWGSLVTEYEEKYVPDETTPKIKPKSEGRNMQRLNREQYDNVRQVFNRGMVLPMKRAPPGLTAQEVESESGATDMSGHSWAATPRSNTRVHNGYYDDSYERTRVKQRMNEANYLGHNKGYLDRDNKMRLSSQSSQYTSDIPVFHSSRDQRMIHADVHRAPMHNRSTDYRSHNEYASGYNNAHGEYRSSGDYSSLPNRRSAHASDNDPFPAHRDSLSARYSSSHHERPSSPESYRYSRRDGRVHSGYSTTPETQRKYRVVNTSPATYASANRHERQSRSVTRGNAYLDQPFSPKRSRAVSVPRDIGTFHGHDHSAPSHTKLKQKSYSQDYLDYDSAPAGSYSSRKKMVKFNGKKSTKKTFDEKAKGVVDDIIDEAIELLSPKYPKKNKSKIESRKSRSRLRQENVVHTTNVLNEINEVNSDRYHQENAVNVSRVYRNNRDAYEVENRRVQDEHRRVQDEHRRGQDERRAIQEFEEDLRVFRQQQRPSLLRPAPLDHSRMSEYRSSIRPVPGSGVTRDGSLPPPRSAYRNYDYELSVGQHAHQTEENKAVNQERSNAYSSDSEYSASHQAHYRRSRTPSRYPNVTFGPTRARSEENLLSAQRKSSTLDAVPRRSVQVQKASRPVNPKFTGSLGYESEPENPKRFNPPTLTRGLVTKILHKLDEDVKRVSKRHPKRPVLNTEQSDTNTWPHAAQHSPTYEPNPHWMNLSSPSSYSPRTDVSIHSPSVASSHPNMEMDSPGHQMSGKVDLYLEETKSARPSETHARFKLYHAENQPNINITIPKDESARLKHLSTINESHDESKYGAFSNEQMIVADLVDKQKSVHTKQALNQVSQLGNLYGTQPDVSMNKQQTLNFFLFNQMKNENEMPKPVYLDDDEQSITFDEDHGQKMESEIEMRDYFINHKGTQTKVDAPKKGKKKDRTKYIIVQQPIPQSPKQIETTHYITQQREIEKLPPEINWREVSIQTDPKVKRARTPSPPKHPSVVEVQSVFNAPVITESRQMEKKNYQLPLKITPPPEPKPPTSREIPIMYDGDFNDTYVEETFQDMHIEKHEPSEDEETVILETIEIEEKEQRIQMSIFEEYEFSHKRTEDGKTVSVGGPDGAGSDIPIFWTPDKYEVVVDKKKKKSTQVKETTQEDEHKKRSGPTEQVDHLAVENNASSHRSSRSPVAVITHNPNFEDTFTREARDNLSALEEVLEKELAQTKEGPNAEKVQKGSFEEADEKGRLQEKSFSSYEKVVPIPKQVAGSENTEKTHTSQKTVYLSPASERKFYSPMKSASNDIKIERKQESRQTRSNYEPRSTKESSGKITYTQLKPNSSQSASKVRTPAYRDSYLSLYSAKPFTATRMYGRNEAISNNWRDRVREAGDDQSNALNSHYTQELYNAPELDLETGTVTKRQFEDVPPPPPVSGLVGESHSHQSEPVAKTHYERDADGNMVKVTEWEHKLTKTVEFPSKETGQKSRTMSSAMDELPEGGYIDMNLHENIIRKSETESSDENDGSTRGGQNGTFSEVTGETQIGRKAFHYDAIENSLKVDDGNEINERKFLYDFNKAHLKPIGRKSKTNGYVYGETMSTQL